mgnify:FL=1
MKTMIAALLVPLVLLGQTGTAAEAVHPDSSDWRPLFAEDLSDAECPADVWSFENGVLTASKDKCIWTQQEYRSFVVDLEFKTAPGTNSGVIVYCSDPKKWIPNSVEVQIADDYAAKWAKAAPSWRCGAIFGHLPARESVVKKPGEWNRYTVPCVGQKITVGLNGVETTVMDMSKWTSAKQNPDGSAIPPWLNKPKAELPTRGRIGFQGKHAGAPIYFRNIRVKELPDKMVEDVAGVWRKHVPSPSGRWGEISPGAASGITDFGSKGYRNTATPKGKTTAVAPGFPKEGPENAFDGKLKKYCVKTKEMWIQYAYTAGAAHTVSAYAITTANDYPTRDPKEWELLGSNDGETWTVVDKREGERFKGRHTTRLFKVANPAAYTTYRLHVSVNCGDISHQFSELQLLETK